MPIREMEKVKGKETDPPLAHPFLTGIPGLGGEQDQLTQGDNAPLMSAARRWM